MDLRLSRQVSGRQTDAADEKARQFYQRWRSINTASYVQVQQCRWRKVIDCKFSAFDVGNLFSTWKL
jgi:hypothetical protein